MLFLNELFSILHFKPALIKNCSGITRGPLSAMKMMLSLYAGTFDPDKVIFTQNFMKLVQKIRNSRAQFLFLFVRCFL